MEKLISKINISKNVLSGKTNQSIICPFCNNYIITSLINKHNQQKIKTVQCTNCKSYISIGDIYNFTSGKKLNHYIYKYNQETYDNKEWSTNYNKM